MSSELNSKKTEATGNQEQTFNIYGKDYKRSDLSVRCINSIIIRQDLQATRVKLSLELEKVNILQKHYDDIIAVELNLPPKNKIEAPKDTSDKETAKV